MAPPWSDSHLNVIADLRVGDIIDVRFSRWDQCDAFIIYERPGGPIPQVRGEPEPREEWQMRYHERMNYRLDFEKRGIPLPERYYGSGGSGRIAPMPREATPKIPHAEP